MKLDRITVIKFLRCCRTNGCMKWRNRFKKERFVVLAEYFEQQTDCSRYRRKICQSMRSPPWRNQALPFLSNKWKTCHRATNSWPHNFRTALEKYFWFQWNCKETTVEARSSIANCGIYFPIFSDTIHTILKIFSQHGLRKCRWRLL